MGQMGRRSKEGHGSKARAACTGLLTTACCLLTLLLAPSAQAATYEQVGTFSGTPGELHPLSLTQKQGEELWPEELQLGAVGGMAINYTGAGGVPKGTLYAITNASQGAARVARFNPDGSFSEAWSWEGTLGGAPKVRCGPEGDPSTPNCPPRWDGGAARVDVDVDQATGNVFLINSVGAVDAGGPKRIHAYNADGTKFLAEFGEQAPAAETFAQSPGKLHDAYSIAVGAEGHLYVNDRGPSFSNRLMEFEPQTPGNYESYVYAGQSSDITLKAFTGDPVADAAGDVYLHNEERVFKFDPDLPANPPLCEFKFPVGANISGTVDPLSGEYFTFSFSDKKVHVFSSCNADGKFAETQKFSIAPPRSRFSAMVFDPSRKFEAGRPAGVLYGASPSFEGGETEETPEGKLVESAMGYVFAGPKQALPPVVEAQSFAHVGTAGASLGATINPNGSETHYAFQYLTLAEYEANPEGERFAGAQEAPVGGADLPASSKGQLVATWLSGLEPDTSYRFRVVASSQCVEGEACEDAGDALGFRTFALEAPGLPDHRVHELVSPADKHGGQVFPANPRLESCSLGCGKPGVGEGRFPMQSTPDGEAMVYEGSAFGEGEGATGENQYLARRDAQKGWQTTTLTPTLLISRGGAGYKGFSTDLSRAVLEQATPAPVLSPEAPAQYTNLYSQASSNPLALTSFLTETPPHRLPVDSELFKTTYAGASADLSRVFFAANDALTSEVPGIAPTAPEVSATEFNLYEWQSATGELSLVNVLPGNAGASPNASFGIGSANSVSDDGSRVFWSDSSGQVYVREDGETTVEVPDPGKFLAAATDGSRVLLDNGHLYDLEEEATTDLTEGKGGFKGLVGQSDDLSHVYFVDTEVLSEEENGEGDKAENGQPNLYAWSGGTPEFVATLLPTDNTTDAGSEGFRKDWAANPTGRTAKASPQGRYVAFLSAAPLTGYDSTGPASARCVFVAAAYADGPCAEAFLYDSAENELVCVSCNPTGAAPLGWAQLPLIEGPGTLPQPNFLLDSGRLYFDSGDSLTQFDTNEGVLDVYQWEPEGVGTCEKEAGCVNLISAGSEPVDSSFVTADEDGKNVFFTTRDKLVLKDKDELIDLYDAREGGGIPAESEVSRGECQGEACQPPVSPPNDPTPASSSFQGSGNVVAGTKPRPRCPKGKARRKGRCVAKKKHKQQRRQHSRAKHERGGAR